MEFELSANQTSTTFDIRDHARRGSTHSPKDNDHGRNSPRLKEWKGPKTIHLERENGGFGFTLRYFVVYPPSSIYKDETKEPDRPTNDTSFSNSDTGLAHPNSTIQPLDTFFVKDILANSPAESTGLAEGDRIVSVNGAQLSGKSYADVVELIQGCVGTLTLVVVPKDDDILQLVYKEHAYNGSSVQLKPRPSSSSSSTSSESMIMQRAAVNKWSTPIYAPSRRSSSGASSDSENLQPKGKKYDPCVQFKAGASVISPEMKINVLVRSSRPGSISSSGSSTPGRKLDISSGTNKTTTYDSCTAFIGGRPIMLRKTSDDLPTGATRKLSGVNPSQLNQALEQTLTLISSKASETHTVGEPSCTTATTVSSRRGSNSRRLSSETVTSPGLVQRLAGVFSGKHDTPESSSLTSVLRDDFKHPTSGQASANSSRKNSHDVQEEVSKHDINSRTETTTKPTERHITPSGTDNVASQGENDGTQVVMEAVSPRLRQRTSSQAAILRRNRGCNLSSLTSQATLVESDGRMLRHLLGEGSFDTAPLPKSPPATSQEETADAAADAVFLSGSTTKTTVPTKQRELIGKKTGYLVSLDGSSPASIRKASSSSETEVIFPAEAKQEDDPNADPNAWRNRRISYLMATEDNKSPTATVKGGSVMIIPEVDAHIEEDEDSDTRSCGRQLSVESISCTDDDEDVRALPTIKEGPLNRKVVQAARGKKRVVSRTWKPVYVYLKGHVLFCHKDKMNGTVSSSLDHDQLHAIYLEGAAVNIAHDYGKRKHVFRIVAVNGSEYLFQAEDTAVMMSWVNSLRDCDVKKEDGLSDDPIAKKARGFEVETAAQASSPPTQKHSAAKKSLSIKKSHFMLGRVNKQKRGFVNVQIAVAKDKEQTAVGFTFGTSLSACPQGKTHQYVPLLVEHCCKVVEDKGLDYIGIYRVPGNAAAVQQLREELDAKEPEAIDWTEDKWYDLNNISSLLKSFLRKLREPIIPHEFYDTLIQSNRKEDTATRLNAIKAQIRALPNYHFDTLKFLIRHLRLVADHHEVNKMEPKNLAIVFGPTVVRASDENMVSMVKDMSDQCRIVETLVHQYEWMFDFDEMSESESPRVKPEEPMDVNGDGIVSSKGLMESLGQVAESMSGPQPACPNPPRGNNKESKGKTSAIMSLTNFTSNFSKLRTKAMSPLFQKKFSKSDTWVSGDSSPPTGERLTSPLQHSPTGSDSGAEGRAWRIGRWDTDEDDALESNAPKGKSSKKHKARALAPLPSWPGVGAGKSKSKEEKKRARSSSLDKDKPRLIVQMPSSPIILRPGKEESLQVDASKAALLSEKTRLRLKQVSEQHQAASERRQVEKSLIDIEHRKLLEDMEKDDEDELLSPLALSPSAMYGDSDGTASNTSDSGPTSRKASLDSLSSPVVNRRFPLHHRQISNSSISSEEQSPRMPMRRLGGDFRRYEDVDMAFDSRQDLSTVTEESHCRISHRAPKLSSSLPTSSQLQSNNSLGTVTLDETLRILLNPSYEAVDCQLEHKTLLETKSKASPSFAGEGAISAVNRGGVEAMGEKKSARDDSDKGKRLLQSIRSIDSKLKTKVIGLHPTSPTSSPSSQEMTLKIDSLKTKRVDLEKKVTNILQENSTRQREQAERHSPSSASPHPGANRLKHAPNASSQTLIVRPASSPTSANNERQDSEERLERNVKNVTQLLRTSQNASSNDNLDLESSLTKLQLNCLKNGQSQPFSRLVASSNSNCEDDGTDVLAYGKSRCEGERALKDAPLVSPSALQTH